MNIISGGLLDLERLCLVSLAKSLCIHFEISIFQGFTF